MSTNPAPESNPASTSSSPSEAPKPPIEPLRLPTPDEIRGQDIWNNCAVRSVFSGVVGGGLGLALGLFLGSFDTPIMQDTMTGKQQFIYQAKQMGRKSWSNCKTFAVMGLIFSAAECVVEKARAKHDTTNTAVAGCVTGGALSATGNLPRHFCKSCRRYWTHGGTLRDIPVGGATRKNAKCSSTITSSPPSTAAASQAFTPFFSAATAHGGAGMNVFGSFTSLLSSTQLKHLGSWAWKGYFRGWR
ncbi:hypothetical protein RHGRI_036187 [Rhododendron griersonianum]|uniref:Mitochondrial import inner membrane translocase subunit Tim17/Tim22/Tim23 family protein n=1 Tax=Rhododendron griersonianum TaxID=479676 RepID=A0AAV6HM34_9ERIC|nr:hypothetical protein RHGRI_036187 [Rhododendron griersonianum]